MLRNLAIHLVLWLCRVFAIVPLDEARRFMGQDKLVRSQRWEAFAVEQGGLYDMIETQRLAAFEAYAETPPNDQATRDHLAMQDRAWRQIRARVDNVIAAGKIEEKNNEAKARLSVGVARKSI